MKFDSCGNKTGPLHWTEGHKIPFTFCIFHFAFYILQPPHNILTLASLIELSSLEEQHNLWLFILFKTISPVPSDFLIVGSSVKPKLPL